MQAIVPTVHNVSPIKINELKIILQIWYDLIIEYDYMPLLSPLNLNFSIPFHISQPIHLFKAPPIIYNSPSIHLNWISPFIGTWGRNRRQLRNHRPLQPSISDPVPILQPPTASVSEYARRIEILANDLANGSAVEGSKPKEPSETPTRGSSRSPGSSSGMKDYLFNIIKGV